MKPRLAITRLLGLIWLALLLALPSGFAHRLAFPLHPAQADPAAVEAHPLHHGLSLGHLPPDCLDDQPHVGCVGGICCGFWVAGSEVPVGGFFWKTTPPLLQPWWVVLSSTAPPPKPPRAYVWQFFTKTTDC